MTIILAKQSITPDASQCTLAQTVITEHATVSRRQRSAHGLQHTIYIINWHTTGFWHDTRAHNSDGGDDVHKRH